MDHAKRIGLYKFDEHPMISNLSDNCSELGFFRFFDFSLKELQQLDLDGFPFCFGAVYLS